MTRDAILAAAGRELDAMVDKVADALQDVASELLNTPGNIDGGLLCYVSVSAYRQMARAALLALAAEQEQR